MRTTPPDRSDVVVRSPSGELDLLAVPELRALLAAAHTPGGRVVLDLQDVTFVDSSALSIVVAADRRLRATGGELRLVRVAAEIMRVLRIVGLVDLVLPAGGTSLLRPRCRAAHRRH